MWWWKKKRTRPEFDKPELLRFDFETLLADLYIRDFTDEEIQQLADHSGISVKKLLARRQVARVRRGTWQG